MNELTTSWHSYPSIYTLGHRYIADLLTQPVVVEEKVDGSQFSFGRFGGEFKARSHGAVLNVLAPDKMFAKAVANMQELDLHDGWTYRGEMLAKPKHNTLVYNRVPRLNVILFDINRGMEDYLSYDEMVEEADSLGVTGLEVVPRLFEGMLTDVSLLRTLLQTESILGGQLIEGVVIKSASLYGQDKKLLMGKFVSETFKEVHNKTWKESNPGQRDIVQRIIEKYLSPARWAKAVQHLREAGQITDSPQDIGLLMREVGPDILKECEDDIKDALFQWAWPDIQRGVTKGLPEWYKEELMKQQFEVENG